MGWEESERPIVPSKAGNPHPGDPVEGWGRRITEPQEGTMSGSSWPASISTKQARIATLAKQMPGAAMTSLSQHMDLEWLLEAYRRTRKDGAAGIDGQTAEAYAEHLEENLRALLSRAKSGTYRAPPVRRVHIPKGDGSKTRPIGIPTFEDKILQRAVLMLVEPVYEQDFYSLSYGFRPRRSARDASEALQGALFKMDGGWVLDVDIASFFDTLDHGQLRDLLRRRISDGVVVRLIGKWLRAGVLEGGVVSHADAGTPQGGVISPLLANIYLHEVLDTWWVKDVLPRLRGRAELTRYADDFVMVFELESDARRVHGVLPERFGRFGLTLHPDKTRLVDYRRPSPRGERRPGTFDFLGFKHYWGTSRKGLATPMRKTSGKRLSRALKTIGTWMKRARHWPLELQHDRLAAKLRGHFNYFGLPGNSRAIGAFRHEVVRRWHHWLARRSQRGQTWAKFNALLNRYPLPPARLTPRPRQLALANL